MRHMDATWRMRGRPTDSRAPTDEVKARFKLNLAQAVLGYVAAGYSLFFIDEAHLSTKTHRGRTWMSRYSHSSRSSNRSAGGARALGLRAGGFFWQYSERANMQTMTEFVRRMFIRHGRILLVMDNASYHKSKALLRELARFGGGVQVVYLPPYSPDLNSVEMIWKELKKYIANGVYKGVNDMTGAMDGMIKGGIVLLPKVPKYLPRAAGRNGTVPGRRVRVPRQDNGKIRSPSGGDMPDGELERGHDPRKCSARPVPRGGILARRQYGIPARVVARRHAPPRPLPHPACNAAHLGTGRSSVAVPGTALPFGTMRHSGPGTSRSSATVPAGRFCQRTTGPCSRSFHCLCGQTMPEIFRIFLRSTIRTNGAWD